MDTLLNNAIQSIQIGVEDYCEPDPRRVLSAIRNIQAGILLLCKERLRVLSPQQSDEVLLKQTVLPVHTTNGEITFVGKGKKTLDQNQIKERFRSLGIVVDWAPLDNLTSHRNLIEHYRFSGRREELAASIAQSATIIRQLMVEVFQADPLDLLGKDCWAILLETEAVYQAELAECRASTANIAWVSPIMSDAASKLACPDCGSELVEQRVPRNREQATAAFRCRSCGSEPNLEALIERALTTHLYRDLYLAATQGGEPPLVGCYQCARHVFVMDECKCAVCGFTADHDLCQSCQSPLTADEEDMNEGLCGMCYTVANMD